MSNQNNIWPTRFIIIVSVLSIAGYIYVGCAIYHRGVEDGKKEAKEAVVEATQTLEKAKETLDLCFEVLTNKENCYNWESALCTCPSGSACVCA